MGVGTVSGSSSELDLTDEVDPTCIGGEVDPTHASGDVDPTCVIEVDPTRRGSLELDPTCAIEVDPTGVSVEVDPTHGNDLTCGGVRVDILNGELNSKRVTPVDGDRGGGAGDACPSDPVNV